MEKELFSFVANAMAGEQDASGLVTYASTFESGWHAQIIFVMAHSFDEAKEIAMVKAAAEVGAL